ncbi:MAG: hypothetical protein ACP5NU_04585 [Methanomicrobiales archaeon]|nr:hypothetical protein [Methanoregulaceae archaeon]HPA08107.1 hypothetical protein [Methanoregulaceae archaeon]HPS22409.1 hypothetical protein [Methanoregulaceae archaeon]HQN88526.1 hypothetical protein [Methanoregulaceae archaeon]HQP82118.1 hypothetical protein [Methanoregulaceae archaeon]
MNTEPAVFDRLILPWQAGDLPLCHLKKAIPGIGQLHTTCLTGRVVTRSP